MSSAEPNDPHHDETPRSGALIRPSTHSAKPNDTEAANPAMKAAAPPAAT